MSRFPPGVVANRRLWVERLIRQKRRRRANLFQYKGLISNPQDLGIVPEGGTITATLDLPANGYLGVGTDTAISSGDYFLEAAGVTFATLPAMSPGEIHPIGWHEENMPIKVSRGLSTPLATITIYVRDDSGRWISIGVTSVA